jgi:hypothetical protein
VGLGPLLPPQAFVLGSQELDADRGTFPGCLGSGTLSHEVSPQLPEVGQSRAGADQPLHPDPGKKQTVKGEAEEKGREGTGRGDEVEGKVVG